MTDISNMHARRQMPRFHILILTIFVTTSMGVASAGYAQFRNQSSDRVQDFTRVDSLHENSIYAKTDSLPNAGDIGLQFLAGEIAFNATSFALWADDLYRGRTDQNMLAGMGVFVSMFTVPIAIDLTTELLHLKTGSTGWAEFGAFGSFFLVTIPVLATIHHPITYLDAYLGFSLPLIGTAQLVYDLTIR